MTDAAKTAFFFVLTPEKMTITDTLKAADLFAKYRVPLSGFIVNRVILTELLGGNIPEYLRNRIEMQRGCLNKIYKQFGRKVLSLVPEFDGEIRGMEMIKLMRNRCLGRFWNGF
jgi:arsenite-transporting ATPase